MKFDPDRVKRRKIYLKSRFPWMLEEPKSHAGNLYVPPVSGRSVASGEAGLVGVDREGVKG